MPRPIVVVDGRTYRHALRMIAVAEEIGAYRHAYLGTLAANDWLRDRIRHGWRWRKAMRYAQLEQGELTAHRLAGIIHPA